MSNACRTRVVTVLAVLAVIGAMLAPIAEAVVACQKGKRVRLRVACAGKEQPVRLDVDALPDLTGDVAERLTRFDAVSRAQLAGVERRLRALESGGSVPACGDTVPECGGVCPAGQVCSNIVTTTALECVCLPGLVGCNADLYPTCGPGTCASPTTCRQGAGLCHCTAADTLP